MFFYQVVLDRPLSTNVSNFGAFTYCSEVSVDIGARVIVEFGTSEIVGVVVEAIKDLESVYELQTRKITIKSILKVIDKVPILQKDQIQLTKWMAEYYLSSWGESIFTLLPSAKREKEIEYSQEVISHFSSQIPELTSQQQECIESINKAREDEQIDMCYVFGITGSGKTEVFLTCIQRCIEDGLQALYLVPEIVMVMQMYPLFCARFQKENVAILHSNLTKSQRLTEWKRIQSGSAQVILGVRSAVFAPVQKLGLIVIDEEHDQAYKSSTTPRYHARQIAIKRVQQYKCVLVMGSATPSLEIWKYKDQNNMKFMQLTERVAGGSLPNISLISLVHTQGCISAPLLTEIQNTIGEQKQVLLLLNRRGFSHSFLCNECGYSLHCPNCSVNLIYHKDSYGSAELRCHHCGYVGKVPEACPQCNFVSMSVKGWGTQRVEKELQSLLPHASVARMDSDIAKQARASENIIGKFYRKEIEIMVGTQIMAKGINFPHLKLVGILFADSLLGIPDFRSEERAFALMTQVAGRAGRFFEDGKVVVQGFDIKNKLFQYLSEYNYADFYDRELEKRKEFQLAPFNRILRLVFRGKDRVRVQDVSEIFLQELNTYKNLAKISCGILGPTSCVVEKLSNNYRFHILLTAKNQSKLVHLCKHVLFERKVQRVANSKRVYIEVDPDPLHIM